jgi:hypothetical protein
MNDVVFVKKSSGLRRDIYEASYAEIGIEDARNRIMRPGNGA